MFFWLFMFVCNLLVPITMIIGGRMLWKHPPKNINRLIGYRTLRSMKNMDTWKFAHDFCGRVWWKTGWIVLVVSAVIHFFCYKKSNNFIGIVSLILYSLQCFILIISVFLTEKALKNTFDKEGKRR